MCGLVSLLLFYLFLIASARPSRSEREREREREREIDREIDRESLKHGACGGRAGWAVAVQMEGAAEGVVHF